MKKIAITILASLSLGASAADFLAVAADKVTSYDTGEKSTLIAVRAGKEINGIQYGLSTRSSRAETKSKFNNSIEGSVGKNLTVVGLNVTPFVGLGRELNNQHIYSFVGTIAGKNVLGGYALAGFSSRIASTEHSRTRQTVVFAGYSYPIAKNLSLNAGIGRSYEDIKDYTVSTGLSVNF